MEEFYSFYAEVSYKKENRHCPLCTLLNLVSQIYITEHFRDLQEIGRYFSARMSAKPSLL